MEDDEEYTPIEYEVGRVMWDEFKEGVRTRLEWLYDKLVPV